MRKFLMIILAIVVVMAGFTACGGNGGGGGNQPANGGDPPEDTGQTFRLVIGSTVQSESASGIALYNYFKPYIEEHSGGRIAVEVHTNSVLGSDREMFEGLQIGTIQANFGPLSVLALFDSDMNVTDLPFLFRDKEHAYYHLDGAFGDRLAQNLPNVGMRILAYAENAFRNISNNARPIHTLEDLQGLDIRTMEAPMHMAIYSSFGINPTPLAFAEVYTALQQGLVDGQDNGVVLTYTARFFEVQRYYTFTEHLYAAIAFVVSEQWYQSLPADLRDVVRRGSKFAAENQRRLNTQMENDLIIVMEEAGMVVHRMAQSERDRLREASLPVWDQFADTITSDIFEMALAIRDEN